MNVISLPAGFVVDLEDDAVIANLLEREVLPTEIAHAMRQADAARILANRYEIGDVIGRGATSTVCRGRDLQFNCPVAIKLLHPPNDKAGEDALRAAIGEACRVRRINSPHVVRVHDAGIDGIPYIVMDLEMEKDSAAEYAAAALSNETYRPRSLNEAMVWVRDAALGVSAAHRLGVYHLDIKPLNVLVEPVSRRAKLIDFGVSATVHGVGGTPAYMAPEHARAIIERVALNTLDCCKLDVFGLGALAYHLIYGEPLRPPVGSVEIQLAIAGDAYPIVPSRQRTVWGKCPARVATIILRALARDPADRYGSAAEMATDIESWLTGFPLLCEQQRPLTCFKLWCTRAKKALAAVAVAIAGVFVLATISMLLRNNVADAKAELDGLRQQIACKERELAARSAEIDTTHEKLTANSKELAESTRANRQFSQEVIALEQRIAIAAERDRQRQQFLDRLSDRNKEITDELASSRQGLQSTKLQLASANQDRTSAMRQLASANQDLARARQQLDQRSSDLDKAQLALGTIQRLLNVTRVELAKTKKDFANAKAQLASIGSGGTSLGSEAARTKKNNPVRAENVTILTMQSIMGGAHL